MTLGLLIIAATLGQVAANEETGTNLMMAVMGLTSGVLVRSSTKRGWSYAMAETASPAPFAWGAKHRLGVVWRALAVFFVSLMIIGGLGALASDDITLALLMGFALIVITAGGIAVGLRYGWNEAQASLLTSHKANAAA